MGCTLFQKSMCKHIHGTSSSIHIINQQNTHSRWISHNLESFLQILLASCRIQLLLGPGRPALLQKRNIHRNSRTFGQLLCKQFCLVKPSFAQLPPVKRNWNDHIRLPQSQLIPPIKIQCSSVKAAVFPAAKVFIFHNRVFHPVIIQKNTSSLVKSTRGGLAVPAVFFLFTHRFSAFVASCSLDGSQVSCTLRTDQCMAVLKNPVTQGTPSGIQQVQKAPVSLFQESCNVFAASHCGSSPQRFPHFQLQ